jgi:hypothetical protein
MTAVSLFDVLARRGSVGAAGANAAPADLIAFAEKLVAGSLADFARVRDYEEQFAWSARREPQEDLEVMRTVAGLYADWADEAAQVIKRVESLGGGSRRIAGIEELHDALGRTRARLTVTPEQIANAKEQVRQGRVVPAKELRDELHARLRA